MYCTHYGDIKKRTNRSAAGRITHRKKEVEVTS
jgi:hypothetical protein